MWRIDELAQRAGTTSRNVRAYQARGLLPPPILRGRTGYYSEEHLQRLEIIAELQARGFSLEAIRQTLDAWARGGDLSHLVGFRHVLTTPLASDAARITGEELVERFPEVAAQPDLIERAGALRLLSPNEDGTYTVASAVLLAAGEELVRAGVPLAAILDLVEAVRPSVGDIADRFVQLVAEHLVAPVREGRVDPAALGEVVASLQRLRPIALEVVRPFLAQELMGAIDRAVQSYGLAAEQSPASD